MGLKSTPQSDDHLRHIKLAIKSSFPGPVQPTPGLKVAIVGLSESSRHAAPWDKGWEMWGLAWDSDRYRFDRVFEMHDLRDMEAFYGEELEGYLEKLDPCQKVYVQSVLDKVPGSERYPFERVAEVCGAYWESSIGYALALAITEGAEEISIWGVDMRADEEYAYQRANCEYLIGLARGRGIKVRIPETSPLLKFSGFNGYRGRYGVTGS